MMIASVVTGQKELLDEWLIIKGNLQKLCSK
jgi:hypothetical protein